MYSPLLLDVGLVQTGRIRRAGRGEKMAKALELEKVDEHGNTIKCLTGVSLCPLDPHAHARPPCTRAHAGSPHTRTGSPPCTHAPGPPRRHAGSPSTFAPGPHECMHAHAGPAHMQAHRVSCLHACQIPMHARWIPMRRVSGFSPCSHQVLMHARARSLWISMHVRMHMPDFMHTCMQGPHAHTPDPDICMLDPHAACFRISFVVQ